MTDSFVKVSAACPKTKVSDIEFNVVHIEECIAAALTEGSKLIIFPELCITSYTSADLFYQQRLLEKSNAAIKKLCIFSENKDIVIVVGAPLLKTSCLFNCAFVIFKGQLLGIVPKSYVPNYTEFYLW